MDLDNKAELDVCSLDDHGLDGHVGSAATHHTGRLFFSVIQTGINPIRYTLTSGHYHHHYDYNNDNNNDISDIQLGITVAKRVLYLSLLNGKAV